jgi:hypothetical protein
MTLTTLPDGTGIMLLYRMMDPRMIIAGKKPYTL